MYRSPEVNCLVLFSFVPSLALLESPTELVVLAYVAGVLLVTSEEDDNIPGQ